MAHIIKWQEGNIYKLIWSHYVPPPFAEMAQRWGERSKDPEIEGLVSPSVREISFLNICLWGADIPL